MKLVSIITSCWNGEKYLHEYFRSLIEQTYQNFEIIVINDGSTDSTEEIIKEYIEKFQKNNIKIIYKKQLNKGQAAATNEALKLINGEYFCLLDCDDTIEPTSIEKRVEFLNNNLDYGFVRTDGYAYDENNMNEPVYSFSSNLENKYIENIFDALILEKGIYVANGCYMFRTDAFKKVNPNMEIFTSSGGQNWQILIPISLEYKCGYIDECLFNYRESGTSHSHIISNSFKKEITRSNEHQQLLLQILSNLEINQQKYKKIIERKYLLKNLDICVKHGQKRNFKKYYEEYNSKYGRNIKYSFYHLLGINRITRATHKSLANINKKIKR